MAINGAALHVVRRGELAHRERGRSATGRARIVHDRQATTASSFAAHHSVIGVSS
jgi:hypothetical protein